MRDVVIALMPALVVSTVVFGADVLRVTALSVAACVAFEYLIQKFLVRGAVTVTNWSAAVTGVLLAFNLPASIPWWIVVIGAFVAIAIAKMTFGGLGKNPFNPALVGRVFLLIAYPVQMTTFPMPVNGAFDALSGATPLAAVKHGAAADVLGVQELLLGNMPGSMGEVAALALLCGFVYLLWRRVITWQIPVTILGTMALFAFVVAAAKGGLSAGPVLWQFPLFHVLAGGALLDVGLYPLHFAEMVFGRPDEVRGLCTKNTHGVDMTDCITLTWKDGRVANLTAAANAVSDRYGVIYGTKGYLMVDNINNPQGLRMVDDTGRLIEEIACPPQLTGYEYEVRETVDCIRRGLPECPSMPHRETVHMMEQMDHLRAQMGIRYPCEETDDPA